MYMSVSGLGAVRAPGASRLADGRVAIRVPRVMFRRRGLGMTDQEAAAWAAINGGRTASSGTAFQTGTSGGSLQVRPGPNGGTEIVDAYGNTVYTADQVAANPSLLSQLSGVCPPGMLPTWEPGGESLCAGSAVIPGEGTVVGPQFNYPVMGQCPVAGWCFTGTNMSDPSSYTWTGGGSPTSLNPALIMSAAPLPSSYFGGSAPAPVPLVVPKLLSPTPQPTTTRLPSVMPSGPLSSGPMLGARTSSPVAPTPDNPGAAAPPAASATSSSVSDSSVSVLTSPVNVLGMSFPAWGIGAAAIAALFLLWGSHK